MISFVVGTTPSLRYLFPRSALITVDFPELNSPWMIPIKTNSQGRTKAFGSMFIQIMAQTTNQSQYESQCSFHDNKLIVCCRKRFFYKKNREKSREAKVKNANTNAFLWKGISASFALTNAKSNRDRTESI